jgi:hypothetical protein
LFSTEFRLWFAIAVLDPHSLCLRSHLFQIVTLKLLSTTTIFSAYARSSISEFRHHSIQSRDRTHYSTTSKTKRQLRNRKNIRSWGKDTEAHVENSPERKSMKSSLIPHNLNQPSFIAFLPNVQRNFNLSPYLHIRDFLDLCKTQNIHGLNA